MSNNLENMNITELKNIAKKMNLPNYQYLQQPQLIEIIRKNNIQYPCIWFILTRKDCKYCEKAKKLLKSSGYVYTEQEIVDENKNSIYQIIDKYTNSYRYFPVIFYNGTFIGGYSELEKFLPNIKLKTYGTTLDNRYKMSDEHYIHQYDDQSWIEIFMLPPRIQYNYEQLWNLHPEEYAKVKIYGKVLNTPRWQQSYGLPYRFSGVQHETLPIPNELLPLYEWATNSPYGPFNQILVNWYQDGNHYIGAHRDDEKMIVPNSPILAISLGQERLFRIRNYKTKEIVDDIPLTNKTVLVMLGKTNQNYTHEIIKVLGVKGKNLKSRISITFRRFKEE